MAIPMVLYTYFLSRVPNYIDAVANDGLTISFWHFAGRTFLSQADAGPTWFLFALLVFSLAYTLWRAVARKPGWIWLDEAACRRPEPKPCFWSALGMASPCLP